MSKKYETSEDIVAGIDKGDKTAETAMVEKYSSQLLYFLKKRTGDPEKAMDLLQETFVKIWRYSKKYDSNKAKLFTWLYRIAYNTSIDKIRSLKKKNEKEVQIDTSSVYKITTNALNQDVLDIKKHLSSIEEKYQIVINALFFEGMTQQEASDELDIPLGTIKSRLKIGLRELKKIYNP